MRIHRRFFESSSVLSAITNRVPTIYDQEYERLITKLVSLADSKTPYKDMAGDIFRPAMRTLQIRIKRGPLVWHTVIFTPVKDKAFWNFSQIGPVDNLSTKEKINSYKSPELSKINRIDDKFTPVALKMTSYDSGISQKDIDGFVKQNLLKFEKAIEYIQKYDISRNELFKKTSVSAPVVVPVYDLQNEDYESKNFYDVLYNNGFEDQSSQYNKYRKMIDTAQANSPWSRIDKAVVYLMSDAELGIGRNQNPAIVVFYNIDNLWICQQDQGKYTAISKKPFDIKILDREFGQYKK